MKTDLFDFELPETAVALHPVSPRDAARMLVVRPDAREMFADHIVRDLPDLLRPGDAMVFNDTRVIPAALDGIRIRDGSEARVSFNLHKRIGDARWLAFARPAKRLAVGDRLRFGHSASSCMLGSLEAVIAAKGDAGEVEIAFDLAGVFLDEAIALVGHMPLPPYIALKRPIEAADAESYQTIYAARDGAVAAPTAGLHFTDELFASLDARGIERHFVTLHVGAGTFLPVKADDTADHKMHAEWGSLSAGTASALEDVRARGGRIVAVGTTALRLLESAAASSRDGKLPAWSGDTSIFITPGYQFCAVDILMTNFHLPRSTLFMLVSAFAGLDTMQKAYARAIASGYRFYSFGDSSLLFRAGLITE
jgi:S-adenosylmethionine:tRNA ribosyltransferase-isomerase